MLLILFQLGNFRIESIILVYVGKIAISFFLNCFP